MNFSGAVAVRACPLACACFCAGAVTGGTLLELFDF